jgi:non-specific serine/threonine protein kinase
MHRLKDLQEPEHLFQVVYPNLPADFPPLKSLNVRLNNLPIQLTSFIGREREIAEVKRLLGAAQLVTLTGSGGAGKTRLALQVAADVLDGYRDGAWLAEFAPTSDPRLVPKTVAAALGVLEQPGREMLETLVDALRHKTLLLVLDNCEHLLTACADLAAALLRACSQVRLLATSRERLGVSGERLWRVPSLSLPDVRHLPPAEDLVQYDAVCLFVDRTVAAAPSFTVTGENAPAIAQICQRLDGIPLAIELAAARMKGLSVGQIAARLDDRFRLLTEGSRPVLPRHQTLGAAIGWSYNLLSATERMTLRRLSVFPGGWTLEAAEAVCPGDGVEASDILDLLTLLVDKSFVIAEIQDHSARYRFLETVRQYGWDRLVESREDAVMRARHRDWYLDLAERTEPKLRGPEQEVWFDQLETEHDNLRAALEWSKTDGDNTNTLLRLAIALFDFWEWCGHFSEGRRWLESALARDRGESAPIRIKALNRAGDLTVIQGDLQRSARFYEEGLARSRALGDKSGIASALYGLGGAASRQGDYEQARELLMESLALFQETKNNYETGVILHSLGTLARHQRDYEAAQAFYQDSLVLRRDVGNTAGIALTICSQGWAALLRGDHKRAMALWNEALTLAARLKSKRTIAWCLAGMSGAAAEDGQLERAARLSGAAEGLLNVLGVHEIPDRATYQRYSEIAREALGATGFASMQAEGRAMALEQAIEYALAEDTG